MGEREERGRGEGEREREVIEKEIEEEREVRERQKRWRETKGERETERALWSPDLFLFDKDSNPNMAGGGAATLPISSKPDYPPKVPPANAITVGVRMSIYEFWGWNKQSVCNIKTVFILVYHVAEYTLT